MTFLAKEGFIIQIFFGGLRVDDAMTFTNTMMGSS